MFLVIWARHDFVPTSFRLRSYVKQYVSLDCNSSNCCLDSDGCYLRMVWFTSSMFEVIYVWIPSVACSSFPFIPGTRCVDSGWCEWDERCISSDGKWYLVLYNNNIPGIWNGDEIPSIGFLLVLLVQNRREHWGTLRRETTRAVLEGSP